jgi:23S rRNA-/tRNA-specific pseudouridylate synthase
VVFTDENLVVINKPPGLLSVPDGYDPTLPHLRSVLEPLLGKLWMVHRLDKETSGLMVLARDADSTSRAKPPIPGARTHQTLPGASFSPALLE